MLFAEDPFKDVRRASSDLNTTFLAVPQKSHYVYVHEGHLVKVENDNRIGALHLLPQFVKIAGSDSTYQADESPATIRIFFDLQHFH